MSHISQNTDSQVKTISFVMIITLIGKLLACTGTVFLRSPTERHVCKRLFDGQQDSPRLFRRPFRIGHRGSFIPVYSEYQKKKGQEEAQRFAGNFITVIGFLTLILSAAGILFADQMVTLFAPDYDAETASLCASLTRIVFPTAFFTGIAYSFVGILQASGEFNVPALISAFPMSSLSYIICF